jgi:hypothetical protein
MIYDRVMMELVHCFLLRGVAIGEIRLVVLSWGCLYYCYKEQITVAGSFLFCNSSFFGCVHL